MAINPLQRSDTWVDKEGKPTDRLAETLEDIIRELNDMTTNAQLFSIRPDSTSAVAQYTVDTSSQGSRGTIVTKFTAMDPAGLATYNVYIGTSATDSTKVINGETATTNGVAPITLIDQLIKPGDSIFLEPSAGNTIVFYASGTERR